MPDPLGAEEQRCCAAGAQGWLPRCLISCANWARTGGSTERIRGPLVAHWVQPPPPPPNRQQLFGTIKGTWQNPVSAQQNPKTAAAPLQVIGQTAGCTLCCLWCLAADPATDIVKNGKV